MPSGKRDSSPKMPILKKISSSIFSIIKIVFGIIILLFLGMVLISFFDSSELENLDGNVAVISISGPIISQSGNFLFEEVSSADDITRMIRKANEDGHIKAVLIEINSPGGSAVASDEIASEIKKINKTNVAWIREIGTSGAYWVASSSDHVIANRMSITGSIGVIASYLDFSGFIEDHNVTYERLVSGKYKDLGSPFKELTPQERALFEESLNDIHAYFIDEVADNRNLSRKDVEKLATGQFFIGKDAKDLGLVDELGSRDEVIAYIEEQIDDEADFVEYRQKKGLWAALSGVMNEKSFFIGKGIGNELLAQSAKPTSVSITT